VVPPGKSRIAAWVLPVFGGSCDGAKKSETMLGSVLAEVELYKDDGSTKVKTSDLYDPCPVLKVKGLDPGAYRLKVRGNSMFCPKCRFEYRLHVDLQD
ncbi:MAG: hypothetical protein FJ096_12955, partial [Deltaproteobacteria bacterium]|nr:hypothetical protein [Deltaproteobacteria bacterium]